MGTDDWEHGSDFHLSTEVGSDRSPWDAHRSGLWGSGTDALRALLALGQTEQGWKRCLVPSYFCQQVLRMLAAQIELVAYDAGPDRLQGEVAQWAEGDVLLNVALFGNAPFEVPDGVSVIEDHSHDPTGPYAHASTAHYAVASLRKTMPLPDGGVLWSPRDLDLPSEVPTTRKHDFYSLQRLTAMALKQVYLAGGAVAHSEFRDLFVRSECDVWDDRPSGISGFSRQRLATLPFEQYRQRKSENVEAFRVALGSPPAVSLCSAPYSVLVVFRDPALRDRVRRRLIDRHIYSSVLWPLDDASVADIPAIDVAFSRRVLSIYADQRYGPDDMGRVANELLATLPDRDAA